MIRPAPGSFAWLAWHELRLTWRNRAKGWAQHALVGLLLAYTVIAILIAFFVMALPIDYAPAIGIAVLAGSVVALSFMVTQAILASQQTLYESRDLDLLFTAPVSWRSVMLAKLAGISGAITLTYAALILPALLPLAILGHPHLLGAVALLIGLATMGAAAGIAITLLLARLVGPRAARTVGQIAAALLGGALFLATQISNLHAMRRSVFQIVFEDLRTWGLGVDGWSGVPGHAAFGDPIAVAAILVVGIGLFAAAGSVLQRLFLRGYQDAGMRFGRARPTGRAARRLFHAGLFHPILAKEWRLLRRDPGLLFQVLLRLVYMLPLLLVMFRDTSELIAPGLTFASVLVAAQLTGSFAWLAVSGEDAPELILVAPVAKPQVDRAKLLAALLMAAPFIVLLPVVIATAGRSPLGGVVALVAAAMGGTAAGLVELRLGKPGQRAAFAKRRGGGSTLAGILNLIISFVFGGSAALIVYFWG